MLDDGAALSDGRDQQVLFFPVVSHSVQQAVTFAFDDVVNATTLMFLLAAAASGRNVLCPEKDVAAAHVGERGRDIPAVKSHAVTLQRALLFLDHHLGLAHLVPPLVPSAQEIVEQRGRRPLQIDVIAADSGGLRDEVFRAVEFAFSGSLPVGRVVHLPRLISQRLHKGPEADHQLAAGLSRVEVEMLVDILIARDRNQLQIAAPPFETHIVVDRAAVPFQNVKEHASARMAVLAPPDFLHARPGDDPARRANPVPVRGSRVHLPQPMASLLPEQLLALEQDLAFLPLAALLHLPAQHEVVVILRLGLPLSDALYFTFHVFLLIIIRHLLPRKILATNVSYHRLVLADNRKSGLASEI